MCIKEINIVLTDADSKFVHKGCSNTPLYVPISHAPFSGKQLRQTRVMSATAPKTHTKGGPFCLLLLFL